MLVTRKSYDAAIFQRNIARERAEQFQYELKQARADIRYLRDKLAKVQGRLDTTEQLLTASEDALSASQVKLARFAALRERGPGGRFLKVVRL